MRTSQTIIRGDRPITRFAPSPGNPRERHLGLRRQAPTRLALSAAEAVGARPSLAIRRAARGHLGLASPGQAHATGAAIGRGVGALRRLDAVTWSRPAESVPHRT